MEDKGRNRRFLAAACAAALTLVAVLIVLFLSGQGSRGEGQIVLPEARPGQEERTEENTAAQEDAVLTVQAENVQAVLESMRRPDTFHQTLTVTRRAAAHTRAGVVDVWHTENVTRAEVADGFETKYLLTDGTRVYVWYDEEDAVCLEMQEGASYEDLAGLPTWEEILRISSEEIQEGGFVTDAISGEALIYVRAQSGAQTREYWVSADSGLLCRQEITEDGLVVYAVEQTALELNGEGEAGAAQFTLPDGSTPF